MVFSFPKLPKLLSPYTDWLEKQQTSILSAAAFITVANIISALSGFLRTRLLVAYFFDTPASQRAFEAFLVASQIPDMMYKLIIFGALSAAFIPIFTEYKKISEQEAFRITSALMNMLLLFFLAVGTIVFFWATPLTILQTGQKFTHDQVMITARLTQIMLAAQFFFAISNFLTGILQSYRKFVLPALAPIVYNLGILLGVYLFAPTFGIYAAGIGVVLGAFLHMAIQFPSVYKLGFRYSFSFFMKKDENGKRKMHDGISSVIKLTPARTSTLGISEVQDLFTGWLSTSIGNLSFVVVNFALSLMTLPIRFFGVPIGQAALPFLSAESDERDFTHFRDILLKSIHQISFFAFPASVLLLILRLPIVRIAYGTRNFPWETTLMTSKVVAIISISITAQAIVQLLIRAFYALKNTRTPFYIAIMSSLLYVGTSLFFVFVLKIGLIGVAISTTISTIAEMIMFLYCLDGKITGLMGKKFWLPQLKMITASFFMAVFLYLPFRILDELIFNTSRSIELIMLTITTGTIGMLVYIYFAMLFDIRELYILQDILNKIGSWKNALSKSQEVILESGIDGDEI